MARWRRRPGPTIPRSNLLPIDVKEAGKLLDDAGWKKGSGGIREKNGETLSVVYITTNSGFRGRPANSSRPILRMLASRSTFRSSSTRQPPQTISPASTTSHASVTTRPIPIFSISCTSQRTLREPTSTER